MLELTGIVMMNPALRQALLEVKIASLADLSDIHQQQDLDASTPDFVRYLKYLEVHPQFISIPKLRVRIQRLRKELELWHKAKVLKQQPSLPSEEVKDQPTDQDAAETQ